MVLSTSGLVLPSAASRAGNVSGVPSGFVGELVMSELLAKYATLAKLGKLFSAYALLTAPGAFSTAAGVGGPLLWNKPNSGIDAHLLAMGFASSVVTTVPGGLGLTGNVGQPVAPTATTPIDAFGSHYIGGPASQLGGIYRVGTPLNAGNLFVPVAQFHTGALTVDNTGLTFVDLGGMLIIPPGGWGAVAASAVLTTLQIAVALIWAELPA